MTLDRTAVLAIVAEQSQNHGKAAELWKDTPDKVAYHTGAVHVCLEIQDRVERMTIVDEHVAQLKEDRDAHDSERMKGVNKWAPV